MSKPILCLDFDGVIHSYTSGWKGPDVIPDEPVPGAIDFIISAASKFQVHIFSSRSMVAEGRLAMRSWLVHFMTVDPSFEYQIEQWVDRNIEFPDSKPPAMVSIDDRCLTFTGEWPTLETLLNFKPWNRKDT